MQNNARDRNDKMMSNMKLYVDIALGSLYIIISIYILKIPSLVERLSQSGVYIFTAIFAVYGLYRIVRGYLGISKQMKERRR